METFTINNILSIFALLGVIAGAVAFTYKSWRDTGDKIDLDTMHRFEASIRALETENTLLKAQISTLQTQVASLKTTNEVLERTVTSHDQIVEIQKTLAAFQPYVEAFTTFTEHDLKIISELAEIKKLISKTAS